MTRTLLDVHPMPAPYSAAGASYTPDAADASLFNLYASTGNDVVVAYNSDTASHTITIVSVADEFHRTGDITATIAAGDTWVSGPIPRHGYSQSGYIQVTADDASVLLLVLSL